MRSCLGRLLCPTLLALQASAARAPSGGFLERRETTFEVTSPKAGETVTLGEDIDVAVQIEWTVPDDIADRPVFLRLVQGPSTGSLTVIENINASAPNTGSYTWRNNVYNALYFSDTLPTSWGAPSGCNYSIAVKAWQDEVFSPYFTIIKPYDGGLSTNATCPQDLGVLRPSEGTYEASSGTAADEDDNAVGSSMPNEDDGSSSSSSSSNNNNNNNNNNENANTSTTSGGASENTQTAPPSSGGISRSTLVIAVSIPTAVLLSACLFLIWLGARQGWFSRRRTPANATTSDDTPGGLSGGTLVEAAAEREKQWGNGRSELHGYDRPYEGGGVEVYQLDGDEDVGRRGGYQVRNT